MQLKPDAVVADIGSGTGYFALRFAHTLPKGRVYGLDTEPDMVRYLTERAKREGVSNVQALRATPHEARLPEPVDLAVLVDVYHHIGNREQYFARLRGALKPGGCLAIIDFRSDSPVGPPQSARVTAEAVKAEMARAGYRLQQEHTFLPLQYFLVFEPSKP